MTVFDSTLGGNVKTLNFKYNLFDFGKKELDLINKMENVTSTYIDRNKTEFKVAVKNIDVNGDTVKNSILSTFKKSISFISLD